MKQPENNEIDSLLRGLASRERSARSGSAGNVTGAHLDADELNSYAAGALPPSTRARFTSHLADCDDCRKIVTQLSLAAGPVIKETPISHSSAPFDWRKMLAALFAPAVLRYAMPAIVLIVVGVAFFAVRLRKESLVAVNSRQSEVSTPTQPGSEINKEQSGQANRFAEPGKAAAPSATQAPSADKAGEKAPKTADTAKPDSSATSSEKEKESPKNEVAALSQPTYAPEPAPPPAAAKPATASETKDSSRVASGNAELKPSAPRKREADKQSEKESDEASASGAPADAPAAGKDHDRKKAKALNDARGAMERRDEERGEQSETRAVGGRHFQRRNSIWVDAAYNSSLSITAVTRGSEQYRALVADEPGIDTIAKQLSGEVILVWKGRAYRIR